MHEGSYKFTERKEDCKTFKSTVQDIAKNIYSKINEPFKNLYNIDLVEALTKVPEIGITKSKTKAQKRRKDGTRQDNLKKSLKNSGPKLTAIPCLGHGNPITREIQRENIFAL